MATDRRAESPWPAVIFGFMFEMIGGGIIGLVLSADGPELLAFLGALVVTIGTLTVLVGCIAMGVEWGIRRART